MKFEQLMEKIYKSLMNESKDDFTSNEIRLIKKHQPKSKETGKIIPKREPDSFTWTYEDDEGDEYFYTLSKTVDKKSGQIYYYLDKTTISYNEGGIDSDWGDYESEKFDDIEDINRLKKALNKIQINYDILE